MPVIQTVAVRVPQRVSAVSESSSTKSRVTSPKEWQHNRSLHRELYLELTDMSAESVSSLGSSAVTHLKRNTSWGVVDFTTNGKVFILDRTDARLQFSSSGSLNVGHWRGQSEREGTLEDCGLRWELSGRILSWCCIFLSGSENMASLWGEEAQSLCDSGGNEWVTGESFFTDINERRVRWDAEIRNHEQLHIFYDLFVYGVSYFISKWEAI